MTNKNSKVINNMALETIGRKKGGGKDGRSVSLNFSQDFWFYLSPTLPFSVAPHLLSAKQKFLIRMLQKLKGQKNTQSSNLDTITLTQSPWPRKLYIQGRSYLPSDQNSPLLPISTDGSFLSLALGKGRERQPKWFDLSLFLTPFLEFFP